MTSVTLAAQYPRIRRVASFEELIEARFVDGINALCWPRTLPGNFEELASHLREVAGGAPGVQPVNLAKLARCRLSSEGSLALLAMKADLQRLQAHGLEPELNWITDYPRDEAASVIATDVYSFHVDRAPVEVDTWLCTYYGVPTEGLRNEDALLRSAVPATRRALLEQFGGIEGAGFEQFLRENSYDLHYFPQPAALPWSFGVGCLWRVAVSWPGSVVPPCIHRAPNEELGAGRLLLIS